MRIDKYLKVSRLIKRRELASEACQNLRVYLNGRAAKPGAQVKPGDRIELHLGSSPLLIEVTDVRETVKKEDAQSLFRVLST